MAKFKRIGRTLGVYSFRCPGCKNRHLVYTKNEGYEHAQWKFNGDVDNPTISPSLLVNKQGVHHCPELPTCHSFIRDGKIEFLSDCTHGLAGQTVELPEIE